MPGSRYPHLLVMPNLSSSSSGEDTSDSDSDQESNDDSICEPTRSKFWGLSSSSDEDGGDEDGTIDGVGGAGPAATDALRDGDPSRGSLEASPGPRGFSTPPRRPVLPVDDPAESWRRIRDDQTFADPPTSAAAGASSSPPCTRIACVSDTHGYHRSVAVPPCDVLIHGGDFTNYGEPDMVADVSEHFAALRRDGTVRDAIVCIAGNHELTFEPGRRETVRMRRSVCPERDGKHHDAGEARRALSNCTYLEDEAATVGGVRFYGSPWQPEFGGWAYNAPRADIWSKWERIPPDTDVLVTHGPPLGRGDATKNQRVGCVSLMKEVQSRVRPRLHVFGHVHEGRGVTYDGTTLYVNASNVSHNYTRRHPAIVVDLPHDAGMPARLVEPDCRLDAEGLLAWLRQNGFEKTAALLGELEDRLAGSDFLNESHDELCCRLLIHRDEEAKAEVKQVATKLWLESFH